jgi:hypothetical protein
MKSPIVKPSTSTLSGVPTGLFVTVIFDATAVVIGTASVVTLTVLDVPALSPPMTKSRNWYAVLADNPVAVVAEALDAIVVERLQVKPPSDDCSATIVASATVGQVKVTLLAFLELNVSAVIGVEMKNIPGT